MTDRTIDMRRTFADAFQLMDWEPPGLPSASEEQRLDTAAG